jgi:hypothetical protein
LGLAASYGAFLWSHPPTAYQFTLVAGVCLLIRIVQFKQWRAFSWIGLSLIGGMLLAAAYFVPATLEQHLIHADDINKTWPYHQTYVFDYVQQGFDHDDWFYARVDWLFFSTTVLLTLLGAAITWPRCRAGYQPALHLGLGALAAVLMTRLSLPIGQHIPKVEIGVFAWRMLGISALAVSLLIGACWQARRWRKALAIGAFGALVVISFCNVVWPMARGEAFVPNPQHFNFATLPATAPREVPDFPPVRVTEGSLRIITWQPEYRVIETTTTRAAWTQWRLFDYPGWTLTLDGEAVTHQRGAYGEIVADVPAGQHQLVAEFRATPIRRAGNWLTLLTALLWLFLFFTNRGRSSYATVGKTF